MPTALNMTMPIKQDAETQKNLEALKSSFATQVQPAIDAALRKSQIVHYARVLVIDNKYIQVITEFDGEPLAYMEFFRVELPDVFKAIFSVVEGVPPWDELNTTNTFWQVSAGFNVRALGNSVDGDTTQGYLFCAYGDTSVREVQTALGNESGAGA